MKESNKRIGKDTFDTSLNSFHKTNTNCFSKFKYFFKNKFNYLKRKMLSLFRSSNETIPSEIQPHVLYASTSRLLTLTHDRSTLENNSSNEMIPSEIQPRVLYASTSRPLTISHGRSTPENNSSNKTIPSENSIRKSNNLILPSKTFKILQKNKNLKYSSKSEISLTDRCFLSRFDPENINIIFILFYIILFLVLFYLNHSFLIKFIEKSILSDNQKK